MKHLSLNNLGVQELDSREMGEVDGGFIPIVVLGISFSAKAVAGWVGGCFLAGVAIGASVAAVEHSKE